MANLTDLVKLRSLRWNRECADLDNRIGDWLAGRTGAMSRAPQADATEEIYEPGLYVPMDGVSGRWFRAPDGRLRRIEEPGRGGRPSADGSAEQGDRARAPLAWWVSRADLPRVALVGSPGEGKSVFLTRLAVALARVFQGADADMADLAVDQLRDRAGQPRLPLVLDASDFAHGTAHAQGEFAIVAAIRRRLSMNGAHWPSESHVAAGLVGGRYFLLVDAWDEIPDARTRNAVLSLLKRLATLFPLTRLVLTTRSASYTGNAAFGPELEVVTLQPLSDDQFHALVHRWVIRKRGSSTDDDVRRHEEALLRAISDLSNRIGAQEPGESVEGNPLMLTAMCALHDKAAAPGLGLPEDRADLCERLVNDLCASRKSEAPEIGVLETPDKRRILERFALAMQRKTEGAQALALGSAEAEILDEFGDDKLPPKDTQRGKRAAWYLQWTADHTGLLTYRKSAEGGEDVRFRHRLFREYLAACRLGRETRNRIEDVAALVQRLWADGRFTDPLWQDVMLLLPGGLADSRAVKLHAALLDLARDACARKGCLLGLAAALVCTRNSGFPDGARKGRLLGLAAAMVVETRRLYGAMDVAARAKEMVREYEQEGATWPMRDRLLFLDMLGRLDPKGGDPRLAENGYRWVSIPGEEGEIEPFDMAWAPVTVQEYRAFVEAADGGNERWWRGAGWETPTDKRRRVHEAASDEWRGQLAHPNWPVTNVSWYEAMSYCRWRTVHDPCGRTIRLPTEAEWQWAVKVLELRTYPSGDRELAAGEAAQENRLETGVWEPSPVGAFPTGSRDGMVDLLGNVWVWCVDMWEGDPEGRVLRGGSFNDGGTPGFVVRDRRAPDSRRSSVGLRLAAAAAGTR